MLSQRKCNLQDIIVQYRMGADLDQKIIHALNYLSKNSKIIGHDFYPLEPHKELHYGQNRREFDLDDYIHEEDYTTSVFLVREKTKNNNKKRKRKIVIKNIPKRYKRNVFFEENMIAIGGGNLKKLKSCMDYIRCGGSTIDKIRYLTGYDSTQNPTKFFYDGYLKLSPKELARRIMPLSGLHSFKIPDLESIKETIKVNFEANPGYILSKLGYKNKDEALGAIVGAFEAIYDNWTQEKYGSKVHIYWTMASRPKLVLWEKGVDKTRHEEAVGRVISLPDAIEQFINHPIWYPIMSEIKQNNKICQFGATPIMLGINRVGYEWNKLRERMKKFKYIYTGDWSKYDRKVNRFLIQNALSAMRELFDLDDPKTKNYVDNWSSFFKEEVMNGTYVLDGLHELERINGVPSGSLFTSLLDSITNYNAIFEVMCSLGYDPSEFEIGTYGDDHYILFDDLKGRSPNAFKEEFFGMSNAMFNFSGSTDEACLCNTSVMEVRYRRPIYDEPWYELMKGTSDLKPSRWEYSPHIFRTYNLMKGETHRQMYDFSNKPKFLSYYWRDDGMPIRPLIECEARILNPENEVKSLDEHESMIWSWIFENIYNTHFVNDMYYVLMDIEYIREEERLWGKGNVSLIKDCKYKKFYNSLPDKLIGQNQRMWFRRRSDINGSLNLNEIDPWIKEFSQRFEEKYNKLIKIYFKIVRGEHHYDVRNRLFNHINNHFSHSKYRNIDNKSNDRVRKILKPGNQSKFGEFTNLPDVLRTINNPDKYSTQRYVSQKRAAKNYLHLLIVGRAMTVKEMNNEILSNHKPIVDELREMRNNHNRTASIGFGWSMKEWRFYSDSLDVLKKEEVTNSDGTLKDVIWSIRRKLVYFDDIILVWMSKKRKYKLKGDCNPKLLTHLTHIGRPCSKTIRFRGKPIPFSDIV